MPRSASKDDRSKFARYRASKRAQGKKLLRMWVPDPNAPGFREEVARQAALLKEAPEEKEVMDWIEAVSADLDLPPYDWSSDEPKTDESSSE
jgi:hypothetical protein